MPDATAVAATDPGVAGAAGLGVLQGLTEFLPVSSSGHLVLFQQFVTIAGDHVLFDLVLHVGTLVPILWFYRRDIADLARDPIAGEGPFWERTGVRMAVLLVIASIPTAAMGLGLQDLFESLFATPAVLTVTFAITGTLLFLTRRLSEGEVDASTALWWQAAVLGLAQGFAITPGISRSGTTIAVALFLGFRREFAARFSFLMSVPAILGAVLIKSTDAGEVPSDPAQLVVGGLAALVSGYFALVLLVRLVRRGQLSHFAWYCWLAAIAAGVIAVARWS